MELLTFYQLMPGKDCGICGVGSCTTFARHVIFHHEDLRKCPWLLEPEDIRSKSVEVRLPKIRVEKSAAFTPCITDSDMVMAEFYLAPQKVDYGFLDPVFCLSLLLYFDCVKCSRMLGIARIEYEGKEILISHTGRVVIRHAADENDAAETCELISRLVSGAVICSNLSTLIECISELCENEFLELYALKLKREEKELITEVEEYESFLHDEFSAMGKGEAAFPEGSYDSLKVKALNLLACNKEGLILYCLAHHLSCMASAIKDAATLHSLLCEKKKREIVFSVAKILSKSYNAEEYNQVETDLRTSLDDPFCREVYKVFFHKRCIAKIKSRFFRYGPLE